jgi:antitoxin ParD1/3/4
LNRTVVNISLTPELENAVKAKVASGLYSNASEIIREALRESLRREHENDWLQREAAIGYAQLDAGQVVRIKSKKEFVAAVRRDP